MANRNEENPEKNERNETNEQRAASKMDLRDSERDRERLRPDETSIELPDVNDIPGQEHVKAAPLGELADTTASSDDEEGVGLFDDEDRDILTDTTASNVSDTEKETLERGDNAMLTRDEMRLQRTALDEEDFEGDAINQRGMASARSGSDLDIPGAEADDDQEAIGDEDEENNHYSMGSDDNDNLTEGTP